LSLHLQGSAGILALFAIGWVFSENRWVFPCKGALSVFANFGSLGIMIVGLVAMAQERRRDIVSLGLKSILAGTWVSCVTGAIVGSIT